MQRWWNEGGYSLADLLVTTGVAGLLLAGVAVIQQSGIQAYSAGASQAEVQQKARVALERMTREIREALAITRANPNSITFAPQGGGGAVTYALNGSDLQRTQGTVAVIAGGVEALTFVYWDFNGASGAAAGNTQRIDVTLRTNQESGPNSDPMKAEVTTSVRLRNVP